MFCSRGCVRHRYQHRPFSGRDHPRGCQHPAPGTQHPARAHHHLPCRRQRAAPGDHTSPPPFTNFLLPCHPVLSTVSGHKWQPVLQSVLTFNLIAKYTSGPWAQGVQHPPAREKTADVSWCWDAGTEYRARPDRRDPRPRVHQPPGRHHRPCPHLRLRRAAIDRLFITVSARTLEQSQSGNMRGAVCRGTLHSALPCVLDRHSSHDICHPVIKRYKHSFSDGGSKPEAGCHLRMAGSQSLCVHFPPSCFGWQGKCLMDGLWLGRIKGALEV